MAGRPDDEEFTEEGDGENQPANGTDKDANLLADQTIKSVSLSIYLSKRNVNTATYVQFCIKNVTFGTMYFTKYATISRVIGINLTLTGGMGINLTLTDPRHGHKLNVNGRHRHKLNVNGSEA